MTADRETPVPPEPPRQQVRASTSASEHFLRVRRELSETPPMGTPSPPDQGLAELDRSRERRIKAWFDLLELERDATDPQLAKLAGVLRRLLGTTHGPT